MQFTIKLKNDRYLDLLLLPSKRILVILSPIPDLTEEQLKDLVATFNYKVALPLTDILLEPYIEDEEVKQRYENSTNNFYDLDTTDALGCILNAANLIISGFEDNEV